VGLREGAPDVSRRLPPETFYTKSETKISMVRRLATFIEAATSEYIEANRQLEHMAVTDGLTGIFNRKYIQKKISEQIQFYQSSGSEMMRPSLIMLDIDKFKSVNDKYGHLEGDNVIIALAKLLAKLQENGPYGTAVGRWGGEEFMVLLPGNTLKPPYDLAEELRKSFGNICFELAGHQTVSAGITTALMEDTVDSICGRVDEALYSAKNAGRNNCIVL
jgi:diguanylate cyclase (GGDEF)-like protein